MKGTKLAGATMNRRGFIMRGATGVGAITAVSSGMAEAAPKQVKQTMSLNILYPNHDGARFDVAYYRSSHIPLAMKVMNADNVILIEGVPMGTTPPAYVMIAHFQFASPEALQAAVANPAMAEVRADVARFTDIRQIVIYGKSS